ncbi:MAG: hypothetical protein JWN86_2809 [Planctomycetota bacterium]|nr:hypothetical protein [Planctomycetota bacterium]
MVTGGFFSLFRPGTVIAVLALSLVLAAWAPGIALVTLLIASWSLVRAWKGSKGLTLRPAIVWGFLAVGLGITAQVLGWSEPLQSGRPVAGHWAYLSSLAVLAALISVLGARTPGGGAWAILMGLLVVVFLLPWLEGSGLARGAGGMDRLRLDPPWSIFFALLILAGVTNYLPTRFGLSAGFVGASLIVELLGLVQSDWPPARRAVVWSLSPLLLALGLILALHGAARPLTPDEPLTRLWLWFRDHWGVVWALRVRERFNRTAESAGWGVRLGWQGPVWLDADEPREIPETAERTLATLLRRFADSTRIEQASRDEAAGACPANELDG